MTAHQKYRHHLDQRGVVLLLALIVLIAMSLAAVALMRGVLTSNRVAANLAFQQSAMQSADVGIETAIAWLEQKARELESVGSTVLADKLHGNLSTASGEAYNYVASRSDPGSSQTWETFWSKILEPANVINTLAQDTAGNTVAFVIHRLCNEDGAPSDGIGCEASPTANASTATSSKSSGIKLTVSSQVYYRITVRVQGPRNAVSFVQAVVAI